MPSAQSPSLAGRAVVAVLLMIGFYLFALTLAAVLFYLPYAEWRYAGRLHVKLAVFGVLSGGVILWSIMPRRDRFVPPGPPLLPAAHPELFAQVRQLAAATGQAPPAEVYLEHDLNAWVAHRDGFMGLGARRVMGLGLPLLQQLTVSQLRGVLAHEFGHFHGGDVQLGPWIYKTRGAIIRTVQSLGDSWLQKPFVWYAKAFLRLTHAISRRQEFAADALAAQVVGARPLMDGLKAAHGGGLAFAHYWQGEVLPLLARGFRPPLSQGFRQFTEIPKIAAAMAQQVATDAASGQADPYDTHPSLRERLEALGRLPPGAPPAADPPALSLLGDTAALEVPVLEALADAATVARLQPVTWADAGQRVWVPLWEEQVRKRQAAFATLTCAAVPNVTRDWQAFARQLGEATADRPPDEQRDAVRALLSGAVTAALARAGWQVVAPPGDAVVCQHTNGQELQPFTLVGRLIAGELTPAAWAETCSAAGVTDLRLLPPPNPEPPAKGTPHG